MINDLITLLKKDSPHHAVCLIGPKDEIQKAVQKIIQELNLPTSEYWQVSELPVTIAQVRQLKHWAMQRPLTGRIKIAYLDLSGMHLEAANALLKLFEEPPPYLFLLASAQSKQEILPTIKSRLQLIWIQAENLQTDAITKDYSNEELLDHWLTLARQAKEKPVGEQIDSWLKELDTDVRHGNKYNEATKLLELKEYSTLPVNQRILLENAFLARFEKSL